MERPRPMLLELFILILRKVLSVLKLSVTRFIVLGGEQGAKEAGKWRLEGNNI